MKLKKRSEWKSRYGAKEFLSNRIHLGLARAIYMYIYGVYAVLLAKKLPIIQSCMVYVYGSGQPYIHSVLSLILWKHSYAHTSTCIDIKFSWLFIHTGRHSANGRATQAFLIAYTRRTTFGIWMSYLSFSDCLYTQDYIRHMNELVELSWLFIQTGLHWAYGWASRVILIVYTHRTTFNTWMS